jgi:oxygen-independent coproporphyrinogen-3 oxidase
VANIDTIPATNLHCCPDANYPHNVSELAGIYIHIPFCLKKCLYCNFYSTTDLLLKDKFVESLLKEIEYYRGSHLTFDTIYFGGGTPSLLSAGEIFSILNKTYKLFSIHHDAEITLEVNPGTVGEKNFRQYADVGINRLNIGVQSFNDKNLQFLGRIHSSQEARSAINSARHAGFCNIGIDLIYGMAGQSLNNWGKDLETALSFFPEHLSCYMLSYEKNTPLYEAKEIGTILPLDETSVGDLFSFTWRFLPANGYTAYEISNFSKNNPVIPGKFRSRHNQKYWHFAPYIGLGPSAHSYLESMRFWNHASVQNYIRLIESGQSSVRDRENLNREQKMIESIFLGLRTKEGIELEHFEKKFSTVFSGMFSTPIKNLEKKGYMVVSDTRCALTAKGMRFHDSICDLIVGAIG